VTRRSCQKRAGRITKGAKNTSKRFGGMSRDIYGLTSRLKKEMQMDDGAFDQAADIISGATSPGLDEELQNSDDSLAADLIAELDDLDLDIGNTVK
jgi:hypothetical protein